ncbi:hypothetical protein, partial [Faecalispora jeddahensis]|uniref:hypothetical protein n=1 Tax=Faecalispora jeddahensis TaxID=1414721 RepID=UPI0019D56F9D
AVARPQAYFTSKGVFLSLSTLKLFPLHRHSRWLFYKEKILLKSHRFQEYLRAGDQHWTDNRLLSVQGAALESIHR